MNIEKVLKWFFILVGFFLLWLIVQGVISGAPLISFVKIIGGTVAFFFGTIILFNLFEKQKWNYKLFRVFQKNK